MDKESEKYRMYTIGENIIIKNKNLEDYITHYLGPEKKVERAPDSDCFSRFRRDIVTYEKSFFCVVNVTKDFFGDNIDDENCNEIVDEIRVEIDDAIGDKKLNEINRKSIWRRAWELGYIYGKGFDNRVVCYCEDGNSLKAVSNLHSDFFSLAAPVQKNHEELLEIIDSLLLNLQTFRHPLNSWNIQKESARK